MTLIPGDGIGPEIAESVQSIFQAAKVRILRVFGSLERRSMLWLMCAEALKSF